MTKKQIVILGALAVFIVIGIVLGLLRPKEKAPFYGGNQNPGPIGAGKANAPLSDFFSSGVPSGAKLTEPAIKSQAAPNAKEESGIFNMTVAENGFEPSVLTVKAGNTTRIILTALDGDYDFSMPYNGNYQFVKRGETKPIAFGLNTPGTFKFQCQNYCPLGGIIEGEVIVLP